MSDTTLEILREARGLVARGWTQGTFFDPNGISGTAYCAEGAIRAAICEATHKKANPKAHAEVVALLMTAFRALYPEWLRFRAADESTRLVLAPWNDAPTRTQAEVVELYDKAIGLAESRVR